MTTNSDVAVLRVRDLAREVVESLERWRDGGSPRALVAAVCALERASWAPVQTLAAADVLATLSVARSVLGELKAVVQDTLDEHLDAYGLVQRAQRIRRGGDEDPTDWAHGVLTVAACFEWMDAKVRSENVEHVQHALAVAMGASVRFAPAVDYLTGLWRDEGWTGLAPVELRVGIESLRELLGAPSETEQPEAGARQLVARLLGANAALLADAEEEAEAAAEFASIRPQQLFSQGEGARPRVIMSDLDDDEVVLYDLGRGRLLLGSRSKRLWWEGRGDARLLDAESGEEVPASEGGWRSGELPSVVILVAGPHRVTIQLADRGGD